MGANCGVGPADVVVAVAEMRTADPDGVLVAKANCGVPQMIDGTLWYPTSSDDMSAYAELALDAGARIVGACCGSIPDHIAQIRAVVDTYRPREGVDSAEIAARLGGSAPVGKETRSSRRSRRSRRASD
jgi:S-methylmethionine-dependent homocysteine/selenocysteine methylase